MVRNLLILFLIVELSYCVNAQTGKTTVYLFKIPGTNPDTCLCDPAAGMYYFVDSSKMIHWIGNKNFCTQDFIYDFDTSYTKEEMIVKPIKRQQKHSVDYIFRFTIGKDNRLYLNKFNNVLRKEETSAYCKLDYSVGENVKPLFSSNGDGNGVYRVKLVKKDTVIAFNDRKFHCYKIEENYRDATGNYSEFLFINKSNLLPVYREQYIKRESLIDIVNSKLQIIKYILLGIMEINSDVKGSTKLWEGE